MRSLSAGIILAMILVTPAAADETAAMRASATGFYGVYKALHVSGVPGDDDRGKFAPFLSPRLEALLKQAAAAEAGFYRANKDVPPMVEGDLFSSLFEGATDFTIGDCTPDGAGGKCVVKLSYSDAANKQAWTDTAYLVRTPSGWRVDDIGYGGGWDFGNKGRLSQTLQQLGQ